MAEIYGGHLVAKHLKEIEGIQTVFSLSGGHIDRIFDGCTEHGLRLVDVRHEQAGVMMAHAWSIYTGQPGVCLVTAGPGFTNALTGVANARQENVPVLILSGIAPLRDRGKGSLQEMDQINMIRSSVKWADICLDVARIPEYISTALRHAVSGRPGPVFLELPPDILNIKVDAAQLPPIKRGSIAHMPQAAPELLQEAAELIDHAQKPVILGGSGIAASGCAEELKAFIEKTGIPFVLNNNSRGAIPDEHPLSLWARGQVAGPIALSMADLVIVLGTRYNWVSNFGGGFPQAKVVRVDIEATEIDRNRASDVGIVADLKPTLRQLRKLVTKREHQAWNEVLKGACAPLIEQEEKVKQAMSEKIHPIRLMAKAREVLGDDVICIADGGDTVSFALGGFRAQEQAGVLAAAGPTFGCLGTGIPFGIGAKLAMPDRTVVVINGDGSFGLNAMEFDTAVRHNVPILCIICNDQAWGMIKHGQIMCYGKDRVIGSELGVVHYEKVVEALGGHGEFVDKDEDIVPAIERALASGKPACVNVITDPDVHSMGLPYLVKIFDFE